MKKNQKTPCCRNQYKLTAHSKLNDFLKEQKKL